MWFPKFVVFFWSFYGLTKGSNLFSCPKGQMVVRSTKNRADKCAPCLSGTFQPEENKSQYCKPCRKCAGSMGSDTLEACTLERNSKCKCREHFVPLENDSSTCECAIGFTKRFEVCVKEEEKSQTKVTASVKHYHLLTNLTSPRPQEGAPSSSRTPSPTPSPTPIPKPAHELTPTASAHLAIFSIVGPIVLIAILLVLTALICKLKLLERMKRRPEQTRNPSFRTPVEESGDGSQDSLKENQQEP